MAEDLAIAIGSKEDQYKGLLPQIRGLVQDEADLIANLANVSAALSQQFGWFWTGFYLVKNEELVVGPFQGPVACTRIARGRGVCGKAWEKGETLIVDDVNQFDGHIACNSHSKSEIVIPIKKEGEVIAVLDIDNDQISSFDKIDQRYLEEIIAIIPFA